MIKHGEHQTLTHAKIHSNMRTNKWSRGQITPGVVCQHQLALPAHWDDIAKCDFGQMHQRSTDFVRYVKEACMTTRRQAQEKREEILQRHREMKDAQETVAAATVAQAQAQKAQQQIVTANPSGGVGRAKHDPNDEEP